MFYDMLGGFNTSVQAIKYSKHSIVNIQYTILL